MDQIIPCAPSSCISPWSILIAAFFTRVQDQALYYRVMSKSPAWEDTREFWKGFFFECSDIFESLASSFRSLCSLSQLPHHLYAPNSPVSQAYSFSPNYLLNTSNLFLSLNWALSWNFFSCKLSILGPALTILSSRLVTSKPSKHQFLQRF